MVKNQSKEQEPNVKEAKRHTKQKGKKEGEQESPVWYCRKEKTNKQPVLKSKKKPKKNRSNVFIEVSGSRIESDYRRRALVWPCAPSPSPRCTWPTTPPLGVPSNSQLVELVFRARKIRHSLPQFSDVGYPTHELGRFVVFSSKYNYTGIYMRCFFDRRAIDIPQNIIIIIYVHIYIFSRPRRSTTSCQLEVYLRHCCRTFTLLLDLSARVASKKKSIKEKSSN